MSAQPSKAIEIGKLTPDEAERFASSFKPVWELDDAPFVQASKLSASEMDALAGGAGIDVEIEAESKITTSSPRVPPPARHERHEDKVVVADIPVTKQTLMMPGNPQQQQALQEAQQQALAKHQASTKQTSASPFASTTHTPSTTHAPTRRSNRPPAAARAQAPTVPDDDFAPIKKSNMGLFIGLGVVAAIVVGIGIVKFGMKSEPTAKPVATTQQTQQERSIPPPPPAADTEETHAKSAPTATATATETQQTQPPPPTATTAQAPAATTTQTQAAITRPATTQTANAQPTTTTGTKPANTVKPSNKGTSGGIVRDTPF